MKNIQELFDLTGRVAVVTGASSGLGVTFTQGLAAAGAKVVLAARRLDRLEKLVSELEEMGHQALAVACDVNDEKDVDQLVATTMNHFAHMDILVNNAGIGNVARAEDEKQEDFRRVIDVNVNGSFLCTQRCGRVMLKAGKGSIINIASMLGFVGLGVIPQTSYNTSKAAIINMTREIAIQWARSGIRVNAIAPGWFHSELTEGLFSDESSKQFINRRTPLARAGEPEELLGTLLLLASDASSYITGQTIVVDGGWTIM
jgi:NAD(P)-dependent dehydrogenase (short-subunit alcohol dehydrogenase family)